MKPKLVSFKLCPFVQRSAVMLEEKGVEYDVEFIELSDKPEWFKKISPLGKVPVLRVGDDVLFESLAINEYLDETRGERLLPDDPIARARDRAFVEVANHTLSALADLTSTRDQAGVDAAAGKLRDRLARFETEVRGPLWHGETFSIVDAAITPTLQRLHWLQDITGVNVLDDLPKVQVWTNALVGRPCVQRSTVPEIRDLYLRFVSRERGDERYLSHLGKRVLAASPG